LFRGKLFYCHRWATLSLRSTVSDGKGEERRGKIEKSPQGYEDNASLDKFCKIKGKKGKKKHKCRPTAEGV
jgi:hypothetical protein